MPVATAPWPRLTMPTPGAPSELMGCRWRSRAAASSSSRVCGMVTLCRLEDIFPVEQRQMFRHDGGARDGSTDFHRRAERGDEVVPAVVGGGEAWVSGSR